jgi:hypothetical protein
MANTSVHLPASLLEELNRIAAERGVSRNALIVESCRRLVEQRRSWPAGLFADDHLTEEEVNELLRSEKDFTEQISKARKSRRRPPF